MISLITVSYNNSSITELFVASAYGSALASGSIIHVIIVNNSQNPYEIYSLNRLSELYPNLTVIHSSCNLGYFGGINRGIEYLSMNKTASDYDLVIVSNNDIVFSPDFFISARSNMAKIQDSAVICPQIVSSDGRYENPHVLAPVSWIRELVYSLYYSNYIFARLLVFLQSALGGEKIRRIPLHHNKSNAHPMQIYQGYGALYILTQRFFNSFDRLNYPGFLMFEEFFLSEQLATIQEMPLFFPELKVFHLGKSSTGSVPRKVIYSYSQGSFKLYRKYIPLFGRPNSLAYSLAIKKNGLV